MTIETESMIDSRIGDDEPEYENDEVAVEDIGVHWAHPRHGLEYPVLRVWPGSIRSNWTAEIREGETAVVVAHMELFERDDGTIDKRFHELNARLPVPAFVRDALLAYDADRPYGPVECVANPVFPSANDSRTENPEGKPPEDTPADGRLSDYGTEKEN